MQQLEEHLGVSSPAGSLSLGQVVFEPGEIRVTQVTGSLGGPASGPVLQATSDQHVVTIALDVSQESEVAARDAVSVTLPDGTTAPGVVSMVGTVTTTSASQQGQNAATTIPVTVTLSDPSAADRLDQAPVTVNVTTATARNVLAVPVTPGIFEDSSGLVQVSGALTPGQRVVVASS